MINEDFLLGYLLSENRYNSEREELIRILRDSHGINVPQEASVLQVARFLGIIELNASYNIRCEAYSYIKPDFREIKGYDEVATSNSMEKSQLSERVVFSNIHRPVDSNCTVSIELIPATN